MSKDDNHVKDEPFPKKHYNGLKNV